MESREAHVVELPDHLAEAIDSYEEHDAECQQSILEDVAVNYLEQAQATDLDAPEPLQDIVSHIRNKEEEIHNLMLSLGRALIRSIKASAAKPAVGPKINTVVRSDVSAN